MQWFRVLASDLLDRTGLCAGESGPWGHQSFNGVDGTCMSVSPAEPSPHPHHGALHLAHTGHFINAYRSESIERGPWSPSKSSGFVH